MCEIVRVRESAAHTLTYAAYRLLSSHFPAMRNYVVNLSLDTFPPARSSSLSLTVTGIGSKECTVARSGSDSCVIMIMFNCVD